MRWTLAGWKYVLTQVLLAGLLLPGVVAGQNPTTNQAFGSFRVMTYNIHHGEGLDRKIDLARIAALIQQARADIVALQEVDRGVPRTGRRDLPAELAKLTGMSCVFSNNYHYQGGEYGNVVLTRFPVQQSTNTLLPKIQAQEQRGMLQVCLQVQGRDLVFMATHLDSRSESERLAQADFILKLVQAYGTKPLMLCGDLNTVPGSQTYKSIAGKFTDTWTVAGKGDGFTIPAEKPKHRIDYIWLSKDAPFKPVKAWVPSSEASDHVPVVAEFQME